MATQPDPLPPPSIPIVDAPAGVPSLSFRQWLLKIAAAVRGLVGFFAAATFATQTTPGTLIAVAVPTNAHAQAAGVPVGGFYTSTADPAAVYIRTV